MTAAASPVLEVAGLRTAFRSAAGPVRAVDGVSFKVAPGETLCIVGESGCGKSATALSVMGLVPRATGQVEAGRILFSSHGDLRLLDDDAMSDIRGGSIGMVFQEPMTSLNPVFRAGAQIAEAVRRHRGVSSRAAHERAVEMLRLVGVPAPSQRAMDYPHQLSGGMRQRVMIAMAIACDPLLLLADEPTTALDVTIQAQILELFGDLQSRLGSAVIFITHDLGVVAEIAQRVCVMYAGVIVEQAPVGALFADPLHPYTRGLLASVPRAGRARIGARRLHTIQGIVPSLARLPRGCRFQDRCPDVFAPCRQQEPPLADPDANPGHAVRCWLHLDAPASVGKAA